MATLALSVAGQFAGGLVGGPFGATIGRALGALAGSAIDNALFSPEQPASLPSPFVLQGSVEGGVIPRVYGWNRLTGNVIWATNLERQSVSNTGSKGMANDTEDQIVANFAVAFCEGEVAHLGRIWADGRILETENLNFRFYKGSDDQLPDALIVAKQGEDEVPGYRGTCYLVFEGLPLEDFGNRIPNISVELCSVVGDLEPAIKAITVIPGSTEFGYDPVPRVRIVSPGKTVGENVNLLGQTSDWTVSIDQLQALCPNLKHVALVVAWFGDDLRCGQCSIRPQVENVGKSVSGANWVVSGNSRNQVPEVSQYQGGPAYGGTPSDASVLAAIADLKSRGIKVTLYPFILMDIEHSNSLTDPYSGSTGQSAYPWRGRITCMPAPGESGSPDNSSAVNTQMDAFVGSATIAEFVAGVDTIHYTGALEWSYRRMVLHYAHLSVLAGGIDAMLIGSEMRGMTWLRNSATGFPFVDALIDLAADVRSIVGTGVKLSYGADWSEYSGLQPQDAPGDKLFHLDALWSSPSIDAIGIDNYMPLADWRGDGNEPDHLMVKHPYQLSYLQANIAGGEGYDWYYASEADRTAGNRTPITDGAAAEPWVWRFKDIKNWWSNTHHNRVSGVRDPFATDWIPQSKPIWFTELGCGAVDKGANQPNVFGDEKSVENARPYFSDGSADPLIQRQFLRAHHQWWQPGSADFDPINNPNSIHYSGQMLDPDRIYVWTWDARPFPAFPNREDVWSDGKNYHTGHWLTGRFGAMGSEEYLSFIASDYGVSYSSISASNLLIQGAQVPNIVSLRGAIQPYLDATGLFIRDDPEGMRVINPLEVEHQLLDSTVIAQAGGSWLTQHTPNSDETVGYLDLAYVDKGSDYQMASASAIANLSPLKSSLSTNLIMDNTAARQSAETMLTNQYVAKSVEFALPFSRMDMQVGDSFQFGDGASARFVINSLRDNDIVEVSANEQFDLRVSTLRSDQKKPATSMPYISSIPTIFNAHISGVGGDMDGTQLIFGAYADPWPGTIVFSNDQGGEVIASLSNNSILGRLITQLQPRATGLWDRESVVEVEIYDGHLSSVQELDVLNGANQLAVIKNDGQCEIVGFEIAQMVGAGRYRLSKLLRGQRLSFEAATILADAGSAVMLLNSSVQQVPIANDQLETEFSISAFAGSIDLTGQAVNIAIATGLAKPLAPVHLRAQKSETDNDVLISWIRRTQIGGDGWIGTEVPLDFLPQFYEIDIFDGAAIVRQFTSATQQATYSEADQIFDFGSALHAFDFSVRQISAVHGVGKSANGSFLG